MHKNHTSALSMKNLYNLYDMVIKNIHYLYTTHFFSAASTMHSGPFSGLLFRRDCSLRNGQWIEKKEGNSCDGVYGGHVLVVSWRFATSQCIRREICRKEFEENAKSYGKLYFSFLHCFIICFLLTPSLIWRKAF